MPKTKSSNFIAAILLALLVSASARAGTLFADLTSNPPPVFDVSTIISDLRLYLNTDSGHVYSQYSNYPWEDRGPDLGGGNRGAVGQVLKQADGSEVMVFNFSNLRLTVRLDIIGSRPAVIMSPGNVLIDATVVVSAGGGAGAVGASTTAYRDFQGSSVPLPGPNGSSAAGTTGGGGGQGEGGVCLVTYYSWGWDWAFAGGGGGGGFVSAGENGGSGHTVNCSDGRVLRFAGGTGGEAYGAWNILSGGGAGGAGGTGTSWGGWQVGGGSGGNGGGAVLFVAGGDLIITANGSIHADGANAPYFDGGAGEGSGGGGAGGYVAFNIAGRWQNDGIISARGGNGSWGAVLHPGATAPASSRDQMGGEGSGGYVAVNPAVIVNTGTIDVSSGALGESPMGGKVLLDAGSIFNSGQITGATNTRNSSVVSTISVVAGTTVPGAPIIGTAIPANTSATVNFSAPNSNGGAAVTGYTVTASPGGSTATGSGSPITISGLANGTAYTFTVRAANANGSGSPSAVSNRVTPSTGPGAPTIGTVTPGDASATVSFTAPSDNGGSPIISYTVTAGSAGYGGSTSASGTASPITVGNLINGQPYTFTITATNANGTSGASAASNSVTPATLPSSPVVGKAIADNASASISFGTIVGQAITSYTASCAAGNASPITASGGNSPIMVMGLANGTAYACSITATNWVGTSGPSESVSVIPRTVPGAPTIGTATAVNGQATVTFTAPSDNGGSAITGYMVTSKPGNVIAYGSASPIKVSGLTNLTSYTFTVTASNAAGTSAASVASNSVAPQPTPGAPSMGAISQYGDGGAWVTFTAPADSGGSAITGYSVTCGSLAASGSASPIAVWGLTNGMTYSCSVAATNAFGTGAISAAMNIVGFVQAGTSTGGSPGGPGTPGAPTNFSIDIGNGRVTLGFTAPSSSGSSSIVGYTANCSSASASSSASGSASPITVTGLTNGATYNCSVAAINAAGTGTAATIPVSIMPRGAPGAPTGVSAIAGNTSAAVSFAPPVDNGGSAIQNYTVISSPGNLIGRGTASPITVSGLSNGTSYTFNVTATNAWNVGATSPASNSVTPAAPGSTTINVFAGWNLVGIGVSAALDVATAFGDATKVVTVWKWDAASSKWAFYTPSLLGPALNNYASGKGYELLSTINAGEGFWVNASQAFGVQLSAGTSVMSADFTSGGSKPLRLGWSLIALGETKTPSQFNTALGIDLTTLWAWDNSSSNWYFYAPSLDYKGGTVLIDYIATKGYLDFTKSNKTLGPGVGFWVNKP